jgi:catechol 2,3-dioxygenase-like lactoylglutathione lyase family enzyme
MWTNRIGAITLFVEDLHRAKAFYQDIFGASVKFEDEDSVLFAFDNLLVNVLKIAAARELIEPATVANGKTGSRCQFTIWVDDADLACTQLRQRGVALLNGPMDREWGQRTASFADPDGHIWELAQELPAAAVP